MSSAAGNEIYLPSHVEYMCGMNTEICGKMEEENGIEIAVYVHSYSP